MASDLLTTSKIGKFIVVPQTKIAFIGFCLSILATFVFMIVQKMGLGKMVIALTLNVLLAILSLYVINCTDVGKCNLYAWIVGYIVLTLGVFAVITLMMKMMSGKKIK